MKEYAVTVDITMSGTIYVKANSQEEAEAMAAVRPFAKIALKAGAKSKAGKEFIKFLVKELLKQGISQTKINEIMTEFGADSVSDKANAEGFDEYDDVSTGVFERSSKKPSTSASSRSNMNSGGGSAMPPDPEKEPEKDRVKPVGENGTFWKSINTGSKQLKNQRRNYAKKSWGKGEVRTDGKHYYQFDRMHKGKPGEHLHRYYKDGKKAVPDAEIDPETGNVKRAIDGGLGEPWFQNMMRLGAITMIALPLKLSVVH